MKSTSREVGSGGGKWQISSGGGTYPMWSRSGRQLFFETLDNRVMVSAYTAHGNSFAGVRPCHPRRSGEISSYRTMRFDGAGVGLSEVS